MKVYVHFMETQSPPFTVAIEVTEENVSIQQAHKAIRKYLLIKGIKMPYKSALSLHKGTKLLDPSESVMKILNNNDDITGKFVTDAKSDTKKAAQSVKKKDLTPDERRKRQLKEALEDCGNMETVLLSDGKTKFDPKTVTDWLMLGEKWKILGEPRKTLDIMFGLINSNKAIPLMYEEIVKVYLEANRPALARTFVETSLKLFPQYTRIKLRDAECQMALNKPDRALHVLMDYTKDLRQSSKTTVEQKHEVQLALCRAYQLKGHKDMALAVIMGVVRELQELDLENIPAMIEYARLTFDLTPTHASEATTIILRSLIGDKDNKFRQKALAEMCQKTGGMKNLLISMQHSAEDPEGLSFMGNTIKKQGALKEALQLHEKAVSKKTDKACVILSYMHIQEVVQNYQKGFDVAAAFLKYNAKMKVASVTNGDVLSCIQPCVGKEIYLLSNQGSDSNRSDSLVSSLELLTMTSEKPCDSQLVPARDSEYSGPLGKPPPIEYNEDEMYLLATWFTIVKVLYLNGAVEVIPKLIKLLDPLHKGKYLHMTLIRNEAAFYSSIAKLAYTWFEPSLAPCIPPTSRHQDLIYFLADSHCLTPAWKTVTFRNRPHIIRPILSTGTKVWHLRPGEVFYPKANFKHCVKQIPYRATVVMLFGEIDCREALVVCYNKCRYESIEEGIDVLLNIYIKTLRDLHEENKWTVFVHPIPPVLEVSRETVSLFNKRLESRLQGEEHLHWLDMVDQFYDKETNAIKYDFDQTHLHPSYIPLLEAAINKISIPEDDAWTVD